MILIEKKYRQEIVDKSFGKSFRFHIKSKFNIQIKSTKVKSFVNIVTNVATIESQLLHSLLI